jgi:protocatechuate 3,4-dioxygenase beta subunit
LTSLGLGLRRPAHIQFRVQAPGFMTLTTHVFDSGDPAIDADPLFSAQSELMADFDAATVHVVFTLARAQPGEEDQ